jgi:hypothetical protein
VVPLLPLLRGTPLQPLKINQNPKRPIPRVFVKQHKNLNSPKNIIFQLVTLFSVCLRAFPFSELFLQKLNSLPNFQFPANPLFLSQFSPSLIRGPYADLILSVTRFNVTYFLIYFFIQYSFHSFHSLFSY